ncbi:GNAT family N-acetyltransferase [Geodermatophilus nigrescens]|uniref:Ornithine-acyl[acyl carrier protein] N-acyltransferase n=1 Tax=Geodermatophilus nigrescens TaxID=1070870 RepID=A0A1M5LTD8_9ACTN|nr:GNAT family N-acyltransferase [Geodermatophilus nigrescens]SHG68170.1 ornithine-acyl[acyl carrier protein] N-acyltransferase [Geodermatophilus nigrescens]
MTAAAPVRPAVRYRTTLARTTADLAEAQRLRHDVFALECGAVLDGPAAADGRDEDEWDALCDHLLVREQTSGQVVGTYRVLPPERAAARGRGYSDGEFDLTRLAPLRPGLVEAGRSCVHPDHRSGAVITQLWAGLARYVLDGGHTHLGGCASVSLADGGATAAGVWDVVRTRHLAPAALRVLPHVPFDVEAPPRPLRPVLPPLLRAYLQLGARVGGPPAHDPAFGTADLYVLLDLADVDPRVLGRLTGAGR